MNNPAFQGVILQLFAGVQIPQTVGLHAYIFKLSLRKKPLDCDCLQRVLPSLKISLSINITWALCFGLHLGLSCV